MDAALQRTRVLARRLTGIADPAVRIAYLRRVVEERPPEEIAEVLALAVLRTEARQPPFGELSLSLCLALADETMVEQRSAVAHAAMAAGLTDTAALLSPRPAQHRSEEAPAVPDFGRGRQLTLGERKSLARGRDRALLRRALRDPHPAVIRILLGNPALTEPDVIQLCAHRPLPEEVVRVVFRSPRWIIRYAVRRAMVRNPFTPVDVGLQLAAHLTQPDAREAAASPELAPSLREACRRVAGVQTIH